MTLQRLNLTIKPEELILHARKKMPSSCRSITASRESSLRTEDHVSELPREAVGQIVYLESTPR